MKNSEIKTKLAEKKVRQWELADELGIREETLSRKLRYELSIEEKNHYIECIDRVSKGKG